jgi:hypothetical protein
MVTCADFLTEYADLRDGASGSARAAMLREHARECGSCARYDRVLNDGVDVLRGLGVVEPSYDFMPRLQHRIFQVDLEKSLDRQRASGASVVLTMGLALAIAATAWAPLLGRRQVVIELPAIAAHAPHQVKALPSVFSSGPLFPRSPSAGFADAPMGIFNRPSPHLTFSRGAGYSATGRIP